MPDRPGERVEGGCRCGAVRYRITITDAGICHCRGCQRASGGAFVPWARARSLELTSGSAVIEERSGVTVGRHLPPFAGVGMPSRSGATLVIEAARGFCAACGTPLFALAAAHGRDTEEVDVCAGTLDDPEALRPSVHLHSDAQLPWLRLADLWPWSSDAALPPSRGLLRGPADPSVTAASGIDLRAITAENLLAALLLDVKGHQRRFVSPVSVSLAQASVQPDAWVRAIYAGDVAVGFAMVRRLDADYEGLPTRGEPFLWRFMIDDRYQGLGLGVRALERVIEEHSSAASAFWLSCVPGEAGPYAFYRARGFTDTGRCDEDGEVILRRDLSAPLDCCRS